MIFTGYHEVSAENPSPVTVPSGFPCVTKQLLNHAPCWEKNKHKVSGGLLITVNSCSCLICDRIWLFSRSCFNFPQGSQPCAASAVMISTWFNHNLPGILLHYHCPDACLPATIKTAKAHVICSSLLLSWCFSFCNIIRNGCLAVQLPNHVSSWDSWDFTNTGHCIVIHLHKSPGAYSHMFTKQTWKVTEWNRTRWPRKENRTKFKQGCLLPNVGGSYGPKKKHMPFAERMRKGKYPNPYTCLVYGCFCLLCRIRVCFSFPRMRVL